MSDKKTELGHIIELFKRTHWTYQKRMKYDREFMILEDELRELCGYDYHDLYLMFNPDYTEEPIKEEEVNG